MGYSLRLFYGVELSGRIGRLIRGADPAVIRSFVSPDSQMHLHKIEKNGKSYLGKSIEDVASLHYLELLDMNIHSLIKRINPEISRNSYTLILIPLINE